MFKFKGCQSFRLRLVCATLAGKSIRIDDIRAQDEQPGLRDFEASFLRLLEKVTNGCTVEINETGTSLRYRPGVITGGSLLQHDCPTTRSIGYFLEPLVVLALYGKKPLSITLRGVTNDSLDPGVDTFRTVTLPLLKRLGVEDAGLELRIVRRGAPPLGGGEVQLKVPIIRQLPAINHVDEGMVRRVRGVAFSTKVSPQHTNRMVDGARGVLNNLLADVFIFTDAVSGKESGISPGFGITLVAETTSGCLVSAEACAGASAPAAAAGRRSQGEGRDDDGEEEEEEEGGRGVAAPGASSGPGAMVPEDVGRSAAHLLLEEVDRGGVADGSHQGLLLLLCALGPEEMNQVRLGPLTPHAVRTLRHIRDFFGVVFDMRTERESKTIFLTCVGAGVRNLSKKAT